MRGRPAIRPAALLLGVLLPALSLLPGEVFRRAAPALAASQAPAFDHIFIIVEENQDYGRIIGNPELPFINSLITNNFLQTDYHGLDHGSLPDYLGLVSGSEQLQAIGSPPTDCLPQWAITPPRCVVAAEEPSNIGDLIERSGRTWRAYLQGMGQPCRWQSETEAYEVIHNPFVYFKTVEGGSAASSPRCIQHDVDMYTDAAHSLQADLMSGATTPNFLFIVPTNHANMHDDRLRPADDFLRDILTGTNTSGQNGANPVNIFASPAWTTQRSIAYIVWDEDSGSRINHVVALEVGAWVNGPRGEDGAPFNHYSLLKTVEVSWGLPPMQSVGGDAAASPMLGAFNLVDGAVPGPAPKRQMLARAHPEVFAQVEARITAGTAPAGLLAFQGSDGVEAFRLSISRAGTLMLDNQVAGTTATSDVPVDPGWHHLGLHVWVHGDAGTCEVDYDGRRLASLSAAGTCMTGAMLIGAVIPGDRAAGDSRVEFRDLAIATGRI